MAKVNVVIVDATGNKEQKVGLPDDIKCGIIMVKLVEKIKLPSVGPDGNPISYKFIHKVTGRQLLEAQTLAEAGIKDGDVLRLQAEITAGGRQLSNICKQISICLLIAIMLMLSGCKSGDYKEAMAAYDAGQWDAAKASFQSLGDYKDSADMIRACDYGKATELFERGEFADAQVLFAELGDYEGSAEMSRECQYKIALQLYNEDKYAEAVAEFANIIEYDKANKAVRKIMFDLITGEFQTALTDATTYFTDYVSEETAAIIHWASGLDESGGTYSFDYSNSNLIAMGTARMELESAADDIRAIFTQDVLEKCDSETRDAYSKMDETAQYATSLFTVPNAMEYLANAISSTGNTAYTPDGLLELAIELETAANNLK